MRGRKANIGAGTSTLTISVSAPSRSPIRLTAMAAPIVSASGFSWHRAVMRRAFRNASATSAMLLRPSIAFVKRYSPSVSGSGPEPIAGELYP
jgi:hypothetical protein